MNAPQNTAIYVHAETDRNWLIDEILAGKFFKQSLAIDASNSQVFSARTLKYFIDEELRHDHYGIDTGIATSFAHASSGEQRKSLMRHILSKEASCIIVDEVFESLDTATREWMLEILTEISSRQLVVQVFSRRGELLPFIDTIYLLEGSSIMGIQDKVVFKNVSGGSLLSPGEPPVPPALQEYTLPFPELVRMENVSVSYGGRKILNNISWQINAGEFWQLSGPNGSGKTTLLSMISGDNPKAYGQDVYLFGRKKGTGETIWEIKEKIGYFAPNMTRDFERHDSIAQMVMSGFVDSVGLYTKPTDMQVKLANDWLSLIGMYEERGQPFRLFPSGKQRMILLARAMVKHPLLLILDEPTSGLDDESAGLFANLVNKLSAETNTAILYVSHRPEPGLQPTKLLQLLPGETGSIGQVISDK